MNASMQAVRWVRNTGVEAHNASVYTLLIFLALVILLLPSQSWGGQEFPPRESSELSSNAGLDLKKVYLSIDTNHEYYQVIHDQTLKRLKDAGLTLNTPLSYKQNDPHLQLTIRVDPLPGNGPPKVLYI